jgi:hypothetical protein
MRKPNINTAAFLVIIKLYGIHQCHHISPIGRGLKIYPPISSPHIKGCFRDFCSALHTNNVIPHA